MSGKISGIKHFNQLLL